MTDAPHRRLSMIVAVLLVVSAALFAVGVAVERSQASSESPAAAAAEAPGHVESGSAGSEASEASAEAPDEDTHTDDGGESILGINPESWGLVALGIAVSVLLAVAALTITGTSRRNLLFGAIALFGLVFAILDVGELIHQVGESRAGIAVLAAVLVVLHLLLSATALKARSQAPAA